MGKENLRPDECADILDCSRRTIYRLVANGELLAFQVGGLKKGGLRIPRKELDNYIKRNMRLMLLGRGLLDEDEDFLTHLENCVTPCDTIGQDG